MAESRLVLSSSAVVSYRALDPLRSLILTSVFLFFTLLGNPIRSLGSAKIYLFQPLLFL